MLKTTFTFLLVLVITTAYTQLSEFEIEAMEPPETRVVQANTQYPDNAMVLVYSSIENLNFRSSIGGINQQRYNQAANRYEILISPQKQILFVGASGFIEQRLTLVNPIAKEVFYYRVEGKTKDEIISVVFQVEPKNASLFVNNRPIGVNTTVQMPIGEVNIRLTAENYETLETVQQINKEQVLYNFKLQPRKAFTDPRDGKTYKTVIIGDQVWMAENLAYKPSSGNYWAYDNNPSNIAKYGFLYDWHTAKKVCPAGWHLPSDEEWTQLTDYLGGIEVAGGKMKSTKGWSPPNTGATNSSGFSGLPGGNHHGSGVVFNAGESGGWWSSTAYETEDAWLRGLRFDSYNIGRGYDFKRVGASVRCLMN